MKPVQGGEAVLICEVPTGVRSPIWSPDGTMISFLTGSPSANGFPQIWVVPLSADGKPAAAPSKFELPGETINLIAGWTPDNKIGILIPSPQLNALHTVPAEGGKATQLTTEYTAMPRWSSDGTRIYFDGAHRGDRANIEYVPSDGGTVARLSIIPGDIQPVFPSQLTISPDGKTLSFFGFDRSGGLVSGLFTVPVQGGTAAMTDVEGNGRRVRRSTLRPRARHWDRQATAMSLIRDSSGNQIVFFTTSVLSTRDIVRSVTVSAAGTYYVQHVAHDSGSSGRGSLYRLNLFAK